ncbi:hypothetical protein VWW18_003165 [Cronobacter sakazakii]|uniref:hypothetical protein n=1 Tax=Cronobacter sakazakii TaxID=28141 RepID=UPI000DA142AE|nr:hypothetical protein [Cronobacter sakazakii]EKY3112498.1 hypothetical protein [Cronobacter sakazakii]EMC4147518.1 hypothetical protein [Cronobacter sakazakii]EME1928534.1 hypothetical protein [Cronobacter sakazakii]EME1932214.1 hypothetical protein [Cronobacter sakazakii]EME1935652.1 hypothetical protein [Cronobacter sakazakii]
MRDLLLETVELQRIILFTKLVANGDCTNSEKELALQWLGEMTGSLERNLDQYRLDKENPHERGSYNSRSGRGFQ